MKPRLLAPALLAFAVSLLFAAPAGAQLRPVGLKGVATLGKVRCGPAGGCLVSVPKRTRQTIAGHQYWLGVMAPQRLPRRSEAAVKLKLGNDAVAGLEGKTAKLRLRVAVTQAGKTRTLQLETRVKRAERGGAAPPPPTSAPLSSEPPLLARPLTAVDVGAVSISWLPRDSWLRYAASGIGPGDGILIGNGATGLSADASPCPDRPVSNPTPLPYTVTYTPRQSWFDPLSGVAGIYGSGSVSFRWGARGIDLTASDPEIEINGAASRAIFRFRGSGGTPYPDQRAALLSLDTAGRPTVTGGGKTFTYGLMRGRLTADGVNVFAGFYTPPSNDEFGCVSVSFTTP
jgi:Htaa